MAPGLFGIRGHHSSWHELTPLLFCQQYKNVTIHRLPAHNKPTHQWKSWGKTVYAGNQLFSVCLWLLYSWLLLAGISAELQAWSGSSWYQQAQPGQHSSTEYQPDTLPGTHTTIGKKPDKDTLTTKEKWCEGVSEFVKKWWHDVRLGSWGRLCGSGLMGPVHGLAVRCTGTVWTQDVSTRSFGWMQSLRGIGELGGRGDHWQHQSCFYFGIKVWMSSQLIFYFYLEPVWKALQLDCPWNLDEKSLDIKI